MKPTTREDVGMIDRETLIDVLKAVEKRLRRDGETISVGKSCANPDSGDLRVNVRLIRVAAEYGEHLSGIRQAPSDPADIAANLTAEGT